MSKERAAQLVDAGVWLKLSGDLDGARRLFERALKLDPSNEKARQLLAQPGAEVPAPIPSPPASNPFERGTGSSPSAVERDFSLVTAAPPPVSSPSSLDADWGSLAGSQTPMPPPPIASAPSATGLPPPPAFASSPSQQGGTQQFAMPREVKAALGQPASSPSGTLAFAMPPEGKGATPPASTPSGTMAFATPPEGKGATPPASTPSGTMAFAMPDEVRAALGDAPPGSTAKFSAMPAVGAPSASAEDELRAMADEEPTSPSLKIDRAALKAPPEACVATPIAPPPIAPPPIAPPPISSAPSSGTMVAFAMPPEVKAALGHAAPPPVSSSPSGSGTMVAFAMPDEVKAAAGQPPVSSIPSGTMVFSLSKEVKAELAAPTPAAEDDEFGKLADEAEEIPLERLGSPSRLAPLPQPSWRPAPKAPVAPPPAPAPSSPAVLDDWGALTDSPERAPSSDSFVPTASQAGLPPPPAFASTPSQAGGTQQFAMPKEVRAASAAAPTSSPSGTMQFAMPEQVSGAATSSPSGTMQFAMPKDVRTELPPEPHAAPKTISLSGELSPQAPETVVLTGDAPPPLPPKATPPLYEGGAVVLEGSAPPPSPPSATPPMFSQPPDPLGVFGRDDMLPAPPGLTPKPQPPTEGAWQWKSSSPPPQAAFEEPPVPRPSPTLDPRAQSAWDQRSNPGIKLEAVVGADRAMDLLSSDSKIQRDPAKARQDEIATILRGARDLLDLDDHTGAMELIAKAEKLAPDLPEVRQLKERSERTLLAMFESRLGHLDKVPRVLLKDDEIIWLNLDHRAGFLLAQIDGTVTFDDLFAVSGMTRLDTARILAQLVDEGVISHG